MPSEAKRNPGRRLRFRTNNVSEPDNNTVRKLAQQNRNPLGVGFYFSLGHSSVVFLMVAAIAFSVRWVQIKTPVRPARRTRHRPGVRRLAVAVNDAAAAVRRTQLARISARICSAWASIRRRRSACSLCRRPRPKAR
ncbi:hypothetical protein [Cohnella thermotolerans]|uniref:HoxN/HupN/NixA family nickel/cobalt transporter n=1 Tax=Cohnella thermotolerans TaxID=329858 RepID=UPI000A05B040